jgi:hypothetical protein
MLAANIDIFSMSYEESVSYFKRLENLEKLKRANGMAPTLPVDNKINVASSSVGVAVGSPKCGVTTVTKITTIQPIAEQLSGGVINNETYI